MSLQTDYSTWTEKGYAQRQDWLPGCSTEINWKNVKAAFEHKLPSWVKIPPNKTDLDSNPLGHGHSTQVHIWVYQFVISWWTSVLYQWEYTHYGLGCTVDKPPDLRGAIQQTFWLKFPVQKGATGRGVGSNIHSHSWAQPTGDPNTWNRESPRSQWQRKGKHGTLALKCPDHELHPALLLTFHWSEVIIWSYLTAREDGNYRLPGALKKKSKKQEFYRKADVHTGFQKWSTQAGRAAPSSVTHHTCDC